MALDLKKAEVQRISSRIRLLAGEVVWRNDFVVHGCAASV